MNKVTIFGKITNEGKLTAVFTDQYRELLKNNTNKRIVMTIEIIPEAGTVLQETYFRKGILPCLQKGFRETGDDMSLAETFIRVLSMCPATSNRDEEMSINKEQYSGLIEWSIRTCAEQFGIIVPEAEGS